MSREDNATAAVEAIKQLVPGFRRLPKADSLYMRFLGKILSPVIGSGTFMEQFSTTVGKTAYLIPDHYNRIGVIFHEGRHAWQCKKYTTAIQGALYLIPQLIAMVAVLPCLVLASLSGLGVTSWAWWPLALTLICAAPLPAYWRMWYEFDAYSVSMAVRYWTTGGLPDDYIDGLIDRFTTSAYYFMWPFRGWLRKRFQRKLEWIQSSALMDDPYYRAIHIFLHKQMLFHQAPG